MIVRDKLVALDSEVSASSDYWRFLLPEDEDLRRELLGMLRPLGDSASWIDSSQYTGAEMALLWRILLDTFERQPAGGSVVENKRLTLWCDAANTYVGSWGMYYVNTSQSYNHTYRQTDTGAIGDYIQWAFAVPAGDYTVRLLGRKQSTASDNVLINIDGNQVGTVDLSNSSNVFNYVYTISATLSAGAHTLQLLANGSSGNILNFTKVDLIGD